MVIIIHLYQIQNIYKYIKGGKGTGGVMHVVKGAPPPTIPEPRLCPVQGARGISLLIVISRLGSRAVTYIQRLEGQSVDVCPEFEQSGSTAMGLYLKHKFPHPERHVASISADGKMSETPQYRGRVKAHGVPGPGPVNVTVSQLRHTDTGIYFCQFNHSGVTVPGSREVFVSVEMAGG